VSVLQKKLEQNKALMGTKRKKMARALASHLSSHARRVGELRWDFPSWQVGTRDLERRKDALSPTPEPDEHEYFLFGNAAWITH